MNNLLFWLTPLFAAFTGWFALRATIYFLFYPIQPVRFMGITIQGILPARQQRLAAQLGAVVAKEFIRLEEMAAMLKDEEQLKQLTPTIEKHLDHFLAVKLQQKLPVISVFMGESTIQKIKEGMLEEIELLLPEVITQYTDSLIKKISIEQMVSEKIAGLSPEKLGYIVRSARKETRNMELFGAGLGFLIGLIQMGLSLL